VKKKPKAQKPQTASKRTPSSKAATLSTEKPSKWIRTDRSLPLPAHVKQALERLDDADHVAYIVGGSVRDFLLGREIKDHDIATSASPDEICELFPNAITVGKQFGVVKVPTGTQPPLLEIATFREDLEYKDHRHPEKVRFSGPVEDAVRRDFTVNALFYDPKTSRILDCTGGMDDLNAGVLRAIGDPKERFREDALRLLRAVRFSATLGFPIEEATADAIKQRAKLINAVSAERIRDELTLMWTGPRPAQALEQLFRLGLLRQVLPELEALRGVAQIPVYLAEGDVWSHTLKVLQKLSAGPAGVAPGKRSATLAWAAVLHDIGKPGAARRSKGTNFNAHEIDAAKGVEEVTHRLRMSQAETQTISALVADQLKIRGVFQMREATLQRLIREPHFEELLELHRADATASDGNLAYYEFCMSRLQELKAKPQIDHGKLVDGNDLIQLGLKPGREFTEILRTIEDLAFEGQLRSKDEALEYVVRHFVK
jgi:poly(A) polymerase